MPERLRETLISVRGMLDAPPLEDLVLHDYELVRDPERRPRITLVIPSISSKAAFGGVTTGLEIFLEIGKRTRTELRILLDDFERKHDTTLLDKYARAAGLDLSDVEVVPRTEWVPKVSVRANDVFISFNWWITLNLHSLLISQSAAFSKSSPVPFIYIIQEYEPLFYPMSSTHMMARAALQPKTRCWGIFNSRELYDFFCTQQHRIERAFVFEPKLAGSMRAFLTKDEPVKVKRVLVYGRPSAPRNCFPAIEKGLRRWVERYPEFSDWEVVSAGLPHSPVRLGQGRTMSSLGKLALEDYAKLLRTSAVGLALMSSPHPSYPPLEMAHFGLRTVTNSYANKDLSTSHSNVISVSDVAPDTIADALARACIAFVGDPSAGWLASSGRPAFVEPGPFPFTDELVERLAVEVWGLPRPEC